MSHAARGHPLHRPREAAGQPGQQHVLAVGAGLHPEAAAHVGRDHPHPTLGQLEQARHLGPDAERGLAGDPHRELLAEAVEGGQHRARLERHRGDAGLGDPERHHVGGGRERARRVALAQGAVQHAIAVDAREERGRAIRHRAFRLGQSGQRLVLDLDQVERVVGRVDVLGHHRGHRDAGRVHGVLGQDRMGRHAHVGHQPIHRHRGEVGGVLSGHHQQHARRAPRRLDVEARDAGVRVRGAEQGHVDAAWRPHVVHVGARAGEEPVILPPLERPPDPAVTGGQAHPPLIQEIGRARRRAPAAARRAACGRRPGSSARPPRG